MSDGNFFYQELKRSPARIVYQELKRSPARIEPQMGKQLAGLMAYFLCWLWQMLFVSYY